MADCTGYGLDQNISLCTDGPVGNGETANLTVTLNTGVCCDVASMTFQNGAVYMVADWDGSETVVDLSGQLGSYGFADVGCTVSAATLTITPDANTNTGSMLLEITLDNCIEDSGNPSAFGPCGGAGPHTISEMTTFTLDGLVCLAMA